MTAHNTIPEGTAVPGASGASPAPSGGPVVGPAGGAGARYCEDCALFTLASGYTPGSDNALRFGRCSHPTAASPDVGLDRVSTRFSVTPGYASTERASRLAGDCGPAGIHWQAKP